MLTNEAGKPFLNRVTSGTYPPGSTVKPLVAAMALDNDIVPEDYVFTERIDWAKRQWLPSRSDWNAPPITRVSNYEGPVNFENAIVNSDNIFFADLSLRAGWDNLDPILTSLGFGESFPFETSVARSTIRAGGSLSNTQLLASSGFGQGEMTISPLQMAYTFSLFANDGDIMRPRLVSGFKKMDGVSSYETVSAIEPSLLSENLISDRSLEYITPMLRKVVTTGSGYNSRLADIETLGKTGTAEIGGNKEREIAWSIMFVRGMEYERLVCVVLEVPTDPETAGSYRHTCVSEMLAP
jgi:penicillin-binding protein